MSNSAPLPRGKVESEIYAGDEHEYDSYQVDGRIIEIPHALIMSGEATDCDRGEAVADGIE